MKMTVSDSELHPLTAHFYGPQLRFLGIPTVRSGIPKLISEKALKFFQNVIWDFVLARPGSGLARAQVGGVHALVRDM